MYFDDIYNSIIEDIEDLKINNDNIDDNNYSDNDVKIYK